MTKHAHYYVIETGGTIGRCKCGEVKDFLPDNQKAFPYEYGGCSKYWTQQPLYTNGGYYLQGTIEGFESGDRLDNIRQELLA